MKKSTKLLILLGAIGPVILVPCMMAFFYYLTQSSDPVEAISSYSLLFWVLQLLISVVGGGMLVFFLVHVTRNAQIKEGIVFWVLIILICGPVGEVAYWYQYIWNEGLSRRSGPLGLDIADGPEAE